MQNFWDDLSDTRRTAAKAQCPHRVGPAPIEDVVAGTDKSVDIGTLDSDDEVEEKVYRRIPTPQKRGAAGNKALVIYFSKLARKTNTETVDFKFLDSLITVAGASVNACDKYGQTALYEVARNWNVDVARFLMHYGADINHKDQWGRTPLHLAAAVNHYEMVEFLIQNGGNINAKTKEENQSPIHYAAKYNAVRTLKVIIENKGYLNDRDYKQRTPLFLAAEMGQQDSARFLIDFGAPVGVFDDTGMSAIGCMVEKMPHVAEDALNQFIVNDNAFRKVYYYLNYLEQDPIKWKAENIITNEYGVEVKISNKDRKLLKKDQRSECPTTALQLAVEHQDLEIIMHPAMQMLIKQKWLQFGRFGAIFSASVHLLFIMIWTWLAVFLPRDGEYYTKGEVWRICMEIVGLALTFYFIVKLIWESKVTYKMAKTFRVWRRRQLNRDLEFCHPRWAQEKVFLESELKASRRAGAGVTSDPWNIFEFVTFTAVVAVIITRLVIIFKPSHQSEETHREVYTGFLILAWVHFMKSCRPFTALGPFISMLGHVIVDTGRFTFLFFEIFIPYAVGFWVLFGGHVNAVKAGEDDPEDWHLFHDSLFSALTVMLNINHNYDALASIDITMAQILVGTFWALSTVMCLNLYIAQLTETFQRVYTNAKANASLLQSMTILQIEKALSEKSRKRAMDTVQEECGPLVCTQVSDDCVCVSEDELWDAVIRRVTTKLTFLKDFMMKKLYSKQAVKIIKAVQRAEALRVQRKKLLSEAKEEREAYQMYLGFLQRDKELHRLLLEIHQMKCHLLVCMGERELPPPPEYHPFPDIQIKQPRTSVELQSLFKVELNEITEETDSADEGSSSSFDSQEEYYQ